ncbi:MAG: hypothetical protein PVH61_29125 [Candidatus Aminicenantes bacterium]|jgi:hypothetical protein
MKTIKIFCLKIFVLIIILFLAQSSILSRICANGAGGGYGEGTGGESAICSTNLIENYIIEGAGHYLDAYSSILSFFNRVELANDSSRDFFLWQWLVYNAITKMNRAAAVYDTLIGEAETTPYNEIVILKLKNFNYPQFRVDNGLKIEIFQDVQAYLQAGDITGVFKRIHANFKEIISRLESIYGEVSQGKMPALVSLWDLNERCSATLLFGQYVSRVFHSLQ